MIPELHFSKEKYSTTLFLFQLQIKDAVKAARIEATEAYKQYVEELETSQRRGRFDLELELLPPYLTHNGISV